MKNLAARLDAAEVAKLEALAAGRRPVGRYDPINDPFDHFEAARDDYYFAAHDAMVERLHMIEQRWPEPGQIYRSYIAALLLEDQRAEHCRALKAAGPKFSTERERLAAEIELELATGLQNFAYEKLGSRDGHGRFDPAIQAEIDGGGRNTAQIENLEAAQSEFANDPPDPLTTAERRAAEFEHRRRVQHKLDRTVPPLLAPKTDRSPQ